jgi:hypothetical protein
VAAVAADQAVDIKKRQTAEGKWQKKSCNCPCHGIKIEILKVKY